MTDQSNLQHKTKINQKIKEISSLSNEYAVLYGIHEAFIINKLEYYLKEILGDKDHIFEGRTYKKISLASWGEILPFLSKGQIERALRNLINQNVICIHKNNSYKRDTTAHYGFVWESIFLETLD